eukprot:jgi/Mesen1/1435/ME000131S00500
MLVDAHKARLGHERKRRLDLASPGPTRPLCFDHGPRLSIADDHPSVRAGVKVDDIKDARHPRVKKGVVPVPVELPELSDLLAEHLTAVVAASGVTAGLTTAEYFEFVEALSSREGGGAPQQLHVLPNSFASSSSPSSPSPSPSPRQPTESTSGGLPSRGGSQCKTSAATPRLIDVPPSEPPSGKHAENGDMNGHQNGRDSAPQASLRSLAYLKYDSEEGSAVEVTHEGLAQGLQGLAVSLGLDGDAHAVFPSWIAQILKAASRRKFSAPEQLAFWTGLIEGDPEPLQLVADLPRPNVLTHHKAQISVQVSADVVHALDGLAHRQGATLFTVLLAAFAALLQRYTGMERLSVGLPIGAASKAPGAVASQANGGVLVAVGTFEEGKAMTFIELVQQMREQLMDAVQHRDLPLGELVRALVSAPDPARAPLFQAAFVLSSARLVKGSRVVSQLAGGDNDARDGWGGAEVALALSESADGSVSGVLEYRPDLYLRESAERLAAHFQELAASAGKSASAPLHELRVMGLEEMHTVLQTFSGAARPYAPHRETLVDLFAAQCARTPSNVAVVDGERTITYMALQDLALRVAALVAEHGRAQGGLAGAGRQLVGLIVDRGIEWVAAMLGIMMAGGGYVPMEPSYPRLRMESIIRQTGLTLVLTTTEHADDLAWQREEKGVALLDLRALPDVSPGALDAVPACAPELDSACYVLFTSGSTGEPKGVRLTHRSVVNIVKSYLAQLPLTEADVIGQVAPSVFDLHVQQLWLALGHGAALAVCSKEELLTDLGAFIMRHRVTYIQVTATVVALLEPSQAPTLKILEFGGEAVPVPLITKWIAEGVTVVNGYGPTECAVTALNKVWKRGDRVVDTIGRSLPGVNVYVLGPHLEALPIGVPGELCLTGVQVSQGYLNRPEATAKQFAMNPYSSGLSAMGGSGANGSLDTRMYRTGDLCRWLPDGQIHFLGRIDFQVKLRGNRIELGEIENVLCQAPGVAKAISTVFQQSLVAYVSPVDPATPLDLRLVRETAVKRLAAYMVPAAYVVLDEFPKTVSGKTDRKKLPPPPPEAFHIPGGGFEGGEQGEEEGDRRARTPEEEAVAGVFAEVLGTAAAADIPAGAGFFEMGGNSLMAVKVIALLRERLGKTLTVGKFFKQSSVAGVASALAGRDSVKAAGAPLVAIDRAQYRQGFLPLSFAQERMWVMDQLDGSSSQYNLPYAWRVRGPLHVARLERALNLLLERHEILRTVYKAEDGVPVQTVRPVEDSTMNLPVFELDGDGDVDEKELQIQRLVRQEAQLPFNLGNVRSLLVRGAVIRAGAREHVVLLTLHHSVFDEGAEGTLFHELAHLYEHGDLAGLPRMSIQYVDYAVWHRAYVGSGGGLLSQQLGYWEGLIGQDPEPLQLVTDYVRASRETHSGSYVPLHLDPPQVAALQALGQQTGGTLFMVLLAAYQALLHRYTGQERVLVGIPVAGRIRAQIEPLVGLFVNTVVTVAEFADAAPGEKGLTFLQLLEQTRARVLEALDNQDVPFEKVVGKLVTVRDPSRSPVFQAGFTLGEGASLALPGMEAVTPIPTFTGAAMFELNLMLSKRDDGSVGGCLEFNTDLYSQASVERMAGHYRQLLAFAAARDADMGVPLQALPFTDEAERALVLERFSGAQVPFQAYPETLVNLFEARLRAAPEAVAVIDDAVGRVTYRELHEKATAVAAAVLHHRQQQQQQLQQEGEGGRGTRLLVGLVMDRGVEWVAAMLGIMMAGGGYVPMEPSYPVVRMQSIASQARLALVLTTAKHLAGLDWMGGAGVSVLDVDTLAPAPGDAAQVAAHGGPSVDDICYVLFTSGSTGEPKGVELAHRSVVNMVMSYLHLLPLDEGSVVGQLSPAVFDQHVHQVWLAFSHGAALAVCSKEELLTNLAGFLSRHDVCYIQATPTLADLLEPSLAPSLKVLEMGGEAVPVGLIARWTRAGVTVVNSYGPTECAVTVTRTVWAAGSEPTDTIGGPLAHVYAYVLGAHQELLPIGVPGELCLAGVQVAEGYLGRADLNAKVFVPNPYSKGPHDARMYRTGDLCRWLPDGSIHILGRIDTQVKLRGNRIELGEIENALCKAPGVSLAVAMLRKDSAQQQQYLAAYLRPHSGVEVDIGEVRTAVTSRLPAYMVPAAYVVLKEFPHSVSGKVDRRRLPEPTSDAFLTSGLALGDERTMTQVEEVVAGIFAEVLGLQASVRVGPHANFFGLGGNSLMAIRVLALISERLGKSISMAGFFQNSTVAGVASQIHAGRAISKGPALTAVARAQFKDGKLPLSFAQERMWAMDQLEGGSAHYNISFAWRIRGHLDLGRLEQALTALLGRHEILRTYFATVEGAPVQIVRRAEDVEVKIRTLRLSEADGGGASAEGEEDGAVRRLARKEALAPFDLNDPAGLPLRGVLVEEDLKEEENATAASCVFLLTVHHIAFDGVSNSVFFRELAHCYEFSTAEGLAQMAVQYADFAIWHRTFVSGARLEEQLAYWRKLIGPNPDPLQLATDFVRPAKQTHNGASVSLSVDADAVAALQALGQQTGGTLFMVLLAAYQALLHRYTGQERVIVGIPVAGRVHPQLESLVGFFVNTVVAVADFEGGDGGHLSFVKLVQQARARVLEALDHQDVPFEKVVADVVTVRDPSRSAVFQTMFSLDEGAGAAISSSNSQFVAGADVTPLSFGSAAAMFELQLSLDRQADGSLAGVVEYNTDLYSAASMRRLAGHYRELLRCIPRNAKDPLHEIPLMRADEESLVLHKFSGVYRPVAVHSETLWDMFEAQVRARPDATAVVDAAVCQVSYAEMHARAERVACFVASRRSAAAGAGKGRGGSGGQDAPHLVGLVMDRGVEWVAAMLGIMMAGGGYVPMEPSFPRLRVESITSQGKLALVLTSGEHAEGLGWLTAEKGVEVAVVADMPPVSEGERAALRAHRPTPESICYVLFTSGSTGEPKGVELVHRSVVNMVKSYLHLLPLDEGSVVGQLSPAVFDQHVHQVWLAFSHGAALAVCSKEELLTDLPGFLERTRTTYIQATPTVVATIQPSQAPGLKFLEMGGEAVPVSLIARWTSAGVLVVNSYGPTETAVTCTRMVWEAGAQVYDTIGASLPGVYAFILGRKTQEVLPVGVPGELCIAGVQVAQGYLNKPELTAKQFVPNPYSKGPHDARMYRTGDLCRWLPSGHIEFLGRLDSQVKMRGYRIELGEIENALCQAPGVGQAVVMVRKDEGQQLFLAAYVRPSVGEASTVDIAAVRQVAASRLPTYMVPSAYMLMEHFPQSVSGKVDRKNLPQPPPEAFLSGGAVKAGERALTQKEEVVAGVFAEVLGLAGGGDAIADVGPHSDFFAMGGNSLMAIKVISLVKERVGRAITVGTFFHDSTVAGIATAVNASGGADSGGAAPPPLVPLDRALLLAGDGGRLPLSFAQERMWAMDQLEGGGGSAHYNIPFAWRIEGALDVPRLESAVRALIARHEALRTLYASHDGTPVQVVLEEDKASLFSLPVVDLAPLAPEEQEAEVEWLFLEEAQTPFHIDDTSSLLMRGRVAKCGASSWVLMLTVHHIAFDEGSSAVFFRELAHVYEQGGSAETLPPVALQYADFAAWNREYMSGAALSRQLVYWKDLIGVDPEPLQLALDFPRPIKQSFRGASVHFSVDAALARDLRQLGQQTGGTLFMVLLAAYQALLHRYTGQERVLVGIPVGGRTLAQLDSVVGLFVNTVVAVADFGEKGEVTFLELLKQTRARVLEALDHQDVPFEKVVADVVTVRDPSRSAVFQTMFTLAEASTITLPGVAVTGSLAEEMGAAKFEIDLSLQKEGDGTLTGVLEYNVDLFSQETVERLAGHYQQFLRAAAAAAGLPLHQLALMGAEEQAMVLHKFSGGGREVETYEETLVDLFLASAAASPQKVAVLSGERSATYQEVHALALQVAAFLLAQGQGGRLVGLVMDRGVEWVAAMLGIMMAGGGYVPMEPTFPRGRMESVSQQAQLSLVLTTPAHLDALAWMAAAAVPLVLVDVTDLPPAEPREESQVTACKPSPDDSCYVLFTSGSTGEPKGVELAHRSVVNLVQAYRRLLPAGATACMAQLAASVFDVHVQEVWLALACGSTLAVCSKEELLTDLGAFLSQHSVTYLVTSPTLATGLQPSQASCLKVLDLGAEAVPVALIRRWTDAGTTVVNGYGPTETAVTATAVFWEAGADVFDTIGTGLPQVYPLVLGAHHGEVLPIGVPGELCIAGVQVAKGYLGRPDLTAEKFVPNLYSTGPHDARMYRTGDLCRWLPSGHLQFFGRMDSQVKLRGNRIELGEVENVLDQAPGVGQAVVLVKKDEAGWDHLTAYLCPEDRAAFSVEGVRQVAASKLTSYMVPTAYVVLDEFPQTVSGKIDRKKLPPPTAEAFYSASGAAGGGSARPLTVQEEMVAGIFAEVLTVGGAKGISARSDFFGLGGNSLMAIRVVSLVRERLGKSLTVGDFFHNSTVAGLVSALRSSGKEEPPLGVVDRAAVAADDGGGLPLSFAQDRMWVMDQIEGGGTSHYNMPAAWRVSGALDVARLERALAAVVARHEVLRTTYGSSRAGVPLQFVRSSAGAGSRPFKLAVFDVSGRPEEGKAAEVEALVEEEAAAPFDLNDPDSWPIRGAVVREGGDRFIVMLTMHHIAFDGESAGVFFEELTHCYEKDGSAEGLPALPLQYVDYAVWQRRYMSGAVLEGQLAYWKELLGVDPEPLQLATDFVRPGVESHRGATVRVSLEAAAVEALRQVAARYGSTLFMVLLAAYQALLHRYTGQERVIVGFPTAGRVRAALEPVVGLFVNTVVAVADFELLAAQGAAEGRGEASFADLLAHVRARVLGALDHQDVPFEKVVGQVSATRDSSRSPVFQTMFSLEEGKGSLESDLQLAGVEVLGTLDGGGGVSAKFELDLGLETVEDGGLSGELVYNADLYAPATAERLASHFQELLRSICRDAASPLSQLAVMQPDERELVLRTFAGLASDGAGEEEQEQGGEVAAATLVELFEAQVAKDASRVAVVDGARSATFSEVHRLARRVAAHVAAKGQASKLVGLVFDRSVEWVAAMLGVLMVGGGYVPMEPSYPRLRTESIVRQAGLAMVLSGAAHLELLAWLPSEQGVEVTALDALEEPAAGAGHGNVDLEAHRPTPESICYVLFTSGSTGEPKGVQLAHRSVVNLVRAYQALLPWDADTCVAQLAPSVFDVHVQEVFLALAYGVPLAICSKEELLTDLGAFLRTNRVTYAVSTPTVVATLQPAQTPGLKVIDLGAEAVPVSLIRKWTDEGVTCVNGYGPTETAVTATAMLWGAGDEVFDTIGKGLANVYPFVLGPHAELLPVGVPGELCIAGIQVAEGYLGRPDLTAEKFVPNPYSTGAHDARMYRTGDLCRWLPSGHLQFLGRMDSQVKLRGNRIELGEIENVLASAPGIGQAAVAVRADANGQQCLVAYFTPALAESAGRVEALLDAHAVQQLAVSKLPSYMIPSAYVVMDEFPQTVSGKIDRKKLPPPTREAFLTGGGASTQGPARPLSQQEEVVAGVFAEVLGTVAGPGVTPSTDFFRMGGNSLMAVRVLAMLTEQLHKSLPMSVFFKDSTVAGVAAALAGSKVGEQGPPLTAMDRSGLENGELPLSGPQKITWTKELQTPGSENIPYAWRVRGDLDVVRLETAVSLIVDRHESLRMFYRVKEGGDVVQVVRPAGEVPLRLPLVDISELPEGETQGAEVTRMTNEEANKPFQLTDPQSLPIRGLVIALGPNEHVLLLTMHHLAFDGESTEPFCAELAHCYKLQSLDGLPPLAVQYGDYVLWHRQLVSGALLDRQLAYWQDVVGLNPAPLQLATDWERPVVLGHRGGSVTVVVGAEVAQGLRRVGQRHGGTLFMVLLAAYQALLHIRTNQEKVLVAFDVAGRVRAQLEPLLGMFVNTVVAAATFAPGVTFVDLLAQVRVRVLEAFDNQDVPFVRVVEALVPDSAAADTSRASLVQTGFTLDEVDYEGGLGTSGLPGLVVEPADQAGYEFAKSEIGLGVKVLPGGGLEGLFVYNTDLYSQATVQGLADEYSTLLESISRDAATAVAALLD